MLQSFYVLLAATCVSLNLMVHEGKLSISPTRRPSISLSQRAAMVLNVAQSVLPHFAAGHYEIVCYIPLASPAFVTLQLYLIYSLDSAVQLVVLCQVFRQKFGVVTILVWIEVKGPRVRRRNWVPFKTTHALQLIKMFFHFWNYLLILNCKLYMA